MLGEVQPSENPVPRKETLVQLPKYKKKKRIKLKICQYCGKEFWGHPIAKYCELHRDVKQREKTKKSPEPGDSNNKTYSHDLVEVVEESWICELDGCGKSYVVKVFPKQYVYPRFCEEHRNEFRRRNYIRQKQIDDIRKVRAAAIKAAAPKVAAKPAAAKPAAVKAVAAPKEAKEVKTKAAKKSTGSKA
jgi:hypothetical protein